ncbi:MAG TPA: hypothetical protein VNM87_04595, partial [Candidatus Udaeobacter sp.]|nr:hypothetical protein [Candidatus Udaeobacter sp.]
MRHEPLAAALSRLNRALSKRSVLSLVALFGTLFSANCSDVPTSPELGGPSSDLHALAAQKPSMTGPEWTVEQGMTDSGGTIALDGMQVSCSFPPGALTSTGSSVLITARMKLNAPKGQANRIDFDFQPSMTFEKPVLLQLQNNYLAGVSRKYVLWFYNPDNQRWEKQDEQCIQEGQPITFKIFHYS